ncbi:HlyD family efflux transporter periplasmic adaptor subunit [Lysinibacillus fusiformis]|uniref:HlyD family efflux transporter periplasmic adaptor subunit n=1 Tax=Lysinibacillus fusiformis TaxID=28031 RepID=UPI0021BF3653|nr:HlyD family efflux transporter periplasmic adaptor subunit [Lysinibacillus fusiformis]UXJ68768.1 HlyD family efflux transporter periplasmic adaptor subunit [Lysinibacillus fusiformis]
MRIKISNLNELTDSREILESKPHPFVSIFISILVVILICALAWSYFGEIDTVAKANGIVRPNEKVHTAQSPINGKVQGLYLKEGQKVREGDLLFSIEQKEVLKELANRKAELGQIEVELNLLNKYKVSIQQRKNQFSKSIENEFKYLKLVDQYIANYKQLEIDFQSNSIDVEQKRNSLEQSSQMTDIKIRENERTFKDEKNKYEVEKGGLENKINQVNVDLDNERKLKKSIISKQNYLDPSDSVRNSRLANYQKKLDQLTLIMNDNEKIYNRSLELGERFVPKAQIENEKMQYENASLELEKFINNTILDIDTNINTLENQLKQTKTDIEGLDKVTDLIINNDGLNLEKQHLAESIQDIDNQKGLLNEGVQVTLKKFELDKVVEINSQIEEAEKKKKTIQENIEQLEISSNKGAVKASTSGTINVIKEINVGEFLQAGEPILSIIPDQESQYKVTLAVPNQEIGKIKIGDKVNFHFSAFPKQNFGYLSGEISSISPDSVTGENGLSYYSVEASLTTKILSNKKGEKGEVKVGMTVEASVIADSKKILHYLLEKVSLID